MTGVTGSVCSNYQSIETCIAKKTYGFNDIVKNILLGFKEKKSLITQQNLTYTEMTYSKFGLYQTLNISVMIDPNSLTKQLLFAMSHAFSYQIYIHDEFFFYINENNLKSISLTMNPNKTANHYYRLALTEVEELDLPADPCNNDPAYNFQACVRESLSSQVGCRLKWDRLSDQERPVCSKMDQYRKYEELYIIVYENGLDHIVRLTGCQKPCHYKKYSFVGIKQATAFVSKNFIFSLLAASKNTIVETEALI